MALLPHASGKLSKRVPSRHLSQRQHVGRQVRDGKGPLTFAPAGRMPRKIICSGDGLVTQRRQKGSDSEAACCTNPNQSR